MSFFSHLFNFPETDPATVHQNLRMEGEILHAKTTARTFRAGRLEVISLGELRRRAEPASGQRTTLRQVVGDAGRLHHLPENNGALFQAASQFNLLEMVNPDVSPRAGITGYAHDNTQGPACAIACAAGTVYRNYFAPVGQQSGQCGPHQIDTLADIAAYFDNDRRGLWEMRNGYALFGERGLRAVDIHLSKLSTAALEDLRGKLQIGVQWRTEVTTVGPEQIVSQAYCSALPIGYHRFHRDPAWERFARLILDATYEATLLAAVENAAQTGNNRCLLTLVGGGVFGNPQRWILSAIERALRLVDRAGLDVAIVSYGTPDPAVTALVDARVEALRATRDSR